MSIYTFRSADTGAPTLAGTAGYLAAVLDAILVNGYNTQTITITRSGTTATATCTAHGYRDKMTLLVSGANEADYNGEFRITVVDANTFTYQVANSPATPATGTISAKVAPVGGLNPYSIAFTGTNIRSYRQGAGSHQFYLGLDDTGTTSARVRGFETMTAAGVAVASGTNPFPSDAQLSGGLYVLKSNAASTAARWWRAYANEKYFHLIIHSTTSSDTADTTGHQRLAFGMIMSRKAGDLYNTVLEAHTTASDTSLPVTFTAAAGTSYIARWADQVSVSHSSGRFFDSGWTNQTRMGGSGGFPYPAPVSGGIAMCRVLLDNGSSGNSDPRGYIPGIWNPLQNVPITHLDTVSGAVGTELEGRTFEYLHIQTSNGQSCFMETSDTWDTL